MITEMYRYAQDEPSLNLSLRLIRLHNELSEKYLKSQEKFTKRELEIIELIAQGLNSWEISDKLHISKHTVDTHRKNIYRKGNFTGIRDVVLFSLVYDMG
ncbi:MAG: helix-turn-helix transcriptional regulator [Bacteroidota bacterium]